MSQRKRKVELPAITPVISDLAGMLALSVRQPWAERIMAGTKTSEYRFQATKTRGRILIYAGLGRFSPDEEAEIADECGLTIDALDALPRGVIVGSVELFDCTETTGAEFEWHLRNPQRFAEPIKPMRRANSVWFHPFSDSE